MRDCQVIETEFFDGLSHQHECGKVALLLVNGFPMCRKHIRDYEVDGLIESVFMLQDAPPPGPPVCAHCGKPAACCGSYEGSELAFACGDCCGHGNEDGWCVQLTP